MKRKGFKLKNKPKGQDDYDLDICGVKNCYSSSTVLHSDFREGYTVPFCREHWDKFCKEKDDE